MKGPTDPVYFNAGLGIGCAAGWDATGSKMKFGQVVGIFSNLAWGHGVGIGSSFAMGDLNCRRSRPGSAF